MLATATVEERIYQRQILKEEVAKAVVDRDGDGGSFGGGGSSRHFSPDELKKLFAAPSDTACDTYDLISQLSKNRNRQLKQQAMLRKSVTFQSEEELRIEAAETTRPTNPANQNHQKKR